jgi:hypothetical protein
MIKLFAVYKDLTVLSRISGYNAEHLKKVRDGHRPLSPHLTRKLRLAMESHGFNTDGMFEEVEGVAA